MDYKHVIRDFFQGLYHSFKGIYSIYSLNKEINERKKKQDSPSKASAVRQRNVDSRENTPVRQIKKPKQSLLKQTLQCGGLNGGIYLASIILFDYVVLWSMHVSFGFIFGKDSFMGNLVWSWIEPTISIIFRTVWVIPLFLLCKIVNSLYFQGIADSAYEHRRGAPVSFQSISKMVADSVFSMATQCLFLIISQLIRFIPNCVAHGISLFLLCMLYSLYTFDYKWVNMGWELPRRLAYIESNWAYFCGFGLPMVLATELFVESWVISGCIFSILFPFYIISGNEANPPTGKSNYPTLRVFAPSIYIANYIFKKTFGSSQKKAVTAPTPAQRNR